MSIKKKVRKVSILRIAMVQLYSAVEHYYEGNYVCSITLAGAAEEILGSIAQKRKGYSDFDGTKEYLIRLFHYFKAPTPSDVKVRNLQNKTKNTLKHNDSGINKRIAFDDFKYVSEQHIMAAIRNYLILYKNPPKHKLFYTFLADMQ